MKMTWKDILTKEEKDTRRLVCELPSGESVHRQGRSLIVLLPEGRATLSSSRMNGGYQEDVTAIFNTQCLDGPTGHITKEEYPEYSKETAKKVDLDPETVVGLSTAVHMDNAAIVTKTSGKTSVTAIVTAGVEGNGGRAGDPASYDELLGYPQMSGTIVIMVIVNADLPRPTMVRAVMTATEAKTCALQQLMASSLYSTGIASGSGTDQVAIVCNKGSDIRLEDAGKHSLLGELIGKCVLEGTLKALDNHARLNPEKQMNALRRLKRYGITGERCYELVTSSFPSVDREVFLRSLDSVAKDPRVVAWAASIIHIQDEISWGLLPEGSGREVGNRLIQEMLPSTDDPPRGTGLMEGLALALGMMAMGGVR